MRSSQDGQLEPPQVQHMGRNESKTELEVQAILNPINIEGGRPSRAQSLSTASRAATILVPESGMTQSPCLFQTWAVR